MTLYILFSFSINIKTKDRQAKVEICEISTFFSLRMRVIVNKIFTGVIRFSIVTFLL